MPQGKYIEASFGDEWHQVLKVLPFDNYAGHNIGAKEKKNPEHIAAVAKDHPPIEDMPMIIEGFINVMRTKANPKTGVSRQIEWLEAFWNNKKSQQKCIDTATKLSIVGKKHINNLTISKKGIEPTIERQKLRFDLPDEVIWRYNGAKVEVWYDPDDLTEVLVTDGSGLRLTAKQYEDRPAALADYKEGDRKRIQGDWDRKKEISARLTSELQEKLAALDGTDIDAESLLQAGVMTKDLKNGAEAEFMQRLYEGKAKSLPRSKPVAAIQLEPSDHEDNNEDVRNLY